jgi:predicted nucleic acid-binding protein
MKIFLDANILFSAANYTSKTKELLIGASRYADLVTSFHTHEEAYRNLSLKTPAHVLGLENLQEYVKIVNAFYNPGIKNLPEHDVPVLAGAIGSKCTFLWTSDKRHFGKLYGKMVHEVTVISSEMLVDILIEMGWKP